MDGCKESSAISISERLERFVVSSNCGEQASERFVPLAAGAKANGEATSMMNEERMKTRDDTRD